MQPVPAAAGVFNKIDPWLINAVFACFVLTGLLALYALAGSFTDRSYFPRRLAVVTGLLALASPALCLHLYWIGAVTDSCAGTPPTGRMWLETAAWLSLPLFVAVAAGAVTFWRIRHVPRAVPLN